jgi:hypothetical protein
MPKGIKNVYDAKVIEYVKEHYLGVTSNELSEMIKRDLGIEETPYRIRQLKKRLKLKCGVDCTFRKGDAPRYKFPKDNIPHNTMPLGSETILNGYVYVKVNDIPYSKANWKPKQQLIWEEQHKEKVPPKHYVIFADGNKRNFDVENLVLVNEKEMMYLLKNNLIYNDCELTKTGLLIAKIKIAVKEKLEK